MNLCVFAHVCMCLFTYSPVYFSRFSLKIGDVSAEMAGCPHRCAAAFTCQLLVEVVSSLMTHGADSDGSACLPARPASLSVPASSTPPSPQPS